MSSSPGIAAQQQDSAAIEALPPYVLVNSRHGPMLANQNDTYIGQALIQYGEYGEIEAEFLAQMIQRPGVVVEVGANIGSLTVPMAKRAAAVGAEMLVFEPQPFVFQNLCANLALNAIGNVRAWPWACGAEAGPVYFPRANYLRPGNFGSVSMHTDKAAAPYPAPAIISAPCVRLDEVLGESEVTLIKIDVEGFELLVLQGTQQTLRRCRPMLYLENDRIELSRPLIEWLWSQQYRLWWHLCPLFNPHNFRGKPENIYDDTTSCNMLGLPRDTDIVVQGCREITDAGYHPQRKSQDSGPG